MNAISDDDIRQVTFSETVVTKPPSSLQFGTLTVPSPAERLTQGGSRDPGTYLDLDAVLGLTELEIGDDSSRQQLTVIDDQLGGRFQIDIAEEGLATNTLTIPPATSEDENNGGGQQITWNTNSLPNAEVESVELSPIPGPGLTVENPSLGEDYGPTEIRVPGFYFDWNEETGTLTRTILEKDGTLTVDWTDPATGEYHKISTEPPIQPEVVEPVQTPEIEANPVPETEKPSVTTKDGRSVSTGNDGLLLLSREKSKLEESVTDRGSDGQGPDWQRNEPAVDDAALKAFCFDSDGDGWGCTGSESCQPPKSQCLDSDGDSWGWTGFASCRMPRKSD